MAAADVSRSSDDENYSDEDHSSDECSCLEEFTLKTLAIFSAGSKKDSKRLEILEKQQKEILANQKEIMEKVLHLTTKLSCEEISSQEVSQEDQRIGRQETSRERDRFEKGKFQKRHSNPTYPLQEKAPITTSKKLKMSPFKPPVRIEDLTEEWREILRPYIIKVTPSKPDKMTVPQIAFFNHWIANQPSLTASNSTIMQLISDGCKSRMWTKEWTPSDGKTLSEYLMNRVKGELTKRRKTKQTQKLERKFKEFEKESFDDLLDYMHPNPENN